MDEDFYNRHADSVIGVFHGLVREDVADLVQETFARMLEGRERMQADTPPHVYLLGIAWNVLREHLRKLGRGRQIDPDVESMAVLEPGPSTIFTRRREHRVLLAALRQLPVRHHFALQLRYWEELTSDDIGEILGLSASGARDLLMRARQMVEQHRAEIERTTPLFVGSTSTHDSL